MKRSFGQDNPPSECKQFHSFVTRLEDQYSRHRDIVANELIYFGTSTTISGVYKYLQGNRNIALGQIKLSHASKHAETLKELETIQKSASEYGDGSAASFFEGPRSAAKADLALAQESAIELTDTGLRAKLLGAKLVTGGLLLLAAEATLRLFTGSTDTLENALNDNPELFLRPDKILGGTASICTAYRNHPDRMKEAEKKLMTRLEARYTLGEEVAKAVADPSFIKKNLAADAVPPSDNTRVERAPGMTPIFAKPAK